MSDIRLYTCLPNGDCYVTIIITGIHLSITHILPARPPPPLVVNHTLRNARRNFNANPTEIDSSACLS